MLHKVESDRNATINMIGLYNFSALMFTLQIDALDASMCSMTMKLQSKQNFVYRFVYFMRRICNLLGFV